MHALLYRPMKKADQEEVAGMITAFYEEAGEGSVMNAGKIERTFGQLADHPDYGSVTVFEADGRLAGYALLVNFWSNEYGGIVLTIDELYVTPRMRGHGIGTAFIRHLAGSNLPDCVALRLEVLPYNRRALQLYEKIGFVKSDRDYLMLTKPEMGEKETGGRETGGIRGCGRNS